MVVIKYSLLKSQMAEIGSGTGPKPAVYRYWACTCPSRWWSAARAGGTMLSCSGVQQQQTVDDGRRQVPTTLPQCRSAAVCRPSACLSVCHSARWMRHGRCVNKHTLALLHCQLDNSPLIRKAADTQVDLYQTATRQWLHLHGGPNNGLFLRVDNFALVNGKGMW